jgi:hypothetical protein
LVKQKQIYTIVLNTVVMNGAYIWFVSLRKL